MDLPIRLIAVRQNNLKGISVEIPSKKLTVITGVSGSGKSSLAFETLYAEGQRRYVESLSTYTRQFLEKMSKPDVEAVENIPPAIALEQRNTVAGSRSTVGTQTEILDFLRVLYARIGQTSCLACGGAVNKTDAESIVDWALGWLGGRKALVVAPAGPFAGRTVLREQGFSRFMIRMPGAPPRVLELEDLEEDPSSGMSVVVDRMKISGAAAKEPETRSRLTDSVEQALAIGRGRMEFVDAASGEGREFTGVFACTACGREHKEPVPEMFSFASPIGACPGCSGFGFTLELDETLVVPDPSKTLSGGAIDPLAKPAATEWRGAMLRFAGRKGISISRRYCDLTPKERALLWNGDGSGKGFKGIAGCFEELKRWKYKLHVRVFIRRYQTQVLCGVCGGTRLRPDAGAVRVGGRTISEVLAMPVSDCITWVRSLSLPANERKIAGEPLSHVYRRLALLDEIGVGYLTLERRAKTLSGGEFQRINLASQLGSGLCGTLYVLDEPSIGLHAADTKRLLGVLGRLRDLGNTVVVVEHDLDVIRAADHVIELGPGAGRRGGSVVVSAPPDGVVACAQSVTGRWLSGAAQLQGVRAPRDAASHFIRLTGCSENNLKNIDVDFPLNRFVVVTGVSGSGKSTLVHKTLYNALYRIFNRSGERAGRFDRLYGAEKITGVVLMDQSPIGRSSRSNPATYLKAWDEVRRLYAAQVLSVKRGYTPQYFSFNVDGGRCPVCRGEGQISVDMHFMAEVRLPCEECGGRRFKKNILDVSYRGRNIHQLLHTTIDEAFDLFRDNQILVRKLGMLRDVGLGYLELGQPAVTLSGGESQRLKIASIMDEKQERGRLYIFDEPTTGLHADDINRLMCIIHDLVDAGSSVVMIEHHLDLIRQSDWVIDLGPGGGEQGGVLVASCPPSKLVLALQSATGKILSTCPLGSVQAADRARSDT